MNTTHAETVAPTGLSGLDAMLRGGIRRRDSILIASLDPRKMAVRADRRRGCGHVGFAQLHL